MKKVLFIAMALVLSLSVFAQQKQVIEFVEQEYDFGTVKEEDGKVSHVFEFVNVSQTPITITNVRASCGCTTPNWSRQPVMPGESGVVTATYSASGRPGRFNKSITVTANDGTQDFQIVLYIKGNVTPRAQQVEAQPVQQAK